MSSSAGAKLPWELIVKIISYTLDPSARPYLSDIQLTRDVIMEYGVQRAIKHIKTVKALENAYSNYEEPPNFLRSLYPDCWHII